MGAVALILCALMACGCSPGGSEGRTFVGFTFGGGGHTFSCEPATWDDAGGRFQLTGGTQQDPTHLVLRGDWNGELGVPVRLEMAEIAADGQSGSSQLVSGSLVVQTRDDTITHGSFDLKTKSADGREFVVVGSFVAKKTSS